MIFSRVISNKLTRSAIGKDCTMLSDHCTAASDPENKETVFCHIPAKFMGGTGTKNSDFCGFYGCKGCHGWFDGDGRNSPESHEYALLAMMKTLHIMHSENLINIKGEKK